jgi:hypothetical protein
MIKHGSHVERHDGSIESAQKLVGKLIKKSPMVPKITRELVDEGLRFDQTEAGKMVNEGLQALSSDASAEIASIKSELAELAKQRVADSRKAEEEKARATKKLEDELKENEKLLHDTKESQKKLEQQIQKLLSQPKSNAKHYIPLSNRIPSSSRTLSVLSIFCWIIETFCKLMRFGDPNPSDVFKYWTVVHWLYWIPFTYLSYAAGPSALTLFVVFFHVLCRLLIAAMFIGSNEEKKNAAQIVAEQKRRADGEKNALVLANYSEKSRLLQEKERVESERKRLEKRNRKLGRWEDDLAERETWVGRWR